MISIKHEEGNMQPDDQIDNTDNAKSPSASAPSSPTLGSLMLRLLDPTRPTWFDKLNKALQPFHDVLTWMVRIQSTIDYIGQFLDALRELGITEHDAHRTLIKYKWIMTPSMPLDFLFQVAEIGRRKGNQRKAMNRLFVEYYSSNNFEQLTVLVNNWSANSFFQPRIRLLQDCVAVMQHAQGKYNAANVVIPTLLAQIDGVQTDFLRTKGIYRRRHMWVDASGARVNWHQTFEHLTMDDTVFHTGARMFLKILFQTAYHGENLKTPTTFSRHKIIHGEYTRYGTRVNAIRAFLILDFLSTLQ
jgi:hypothetical protein